jgi:hypothetical protein
VGCIPGTFTTPASLTWNANTNCTISFQSPQTIGGSFYVFNSATVNGGLETSANPLTINSGGSPPTIHANFTAPCAYTLAPSSQSFDAQGGSGTLSVTTSNACSWTASTDSPSWVSLNGSLCPAGACNTRPRSGPGAVLFIVSANAGTAARSAFIFVANQVFRVDQQGFACVYTAAPTYFTLATSGGNVVPIVTAPASCRWASTSNASWLARAPPRLPARQ